MSKNISAAVISFHFCGEQISKDTKFCCVFFCTQHHIHHCNKRCTMTTKTIKHPFYISLKTKSLLSFPQLAPHLRLPREKQRNKNKNPLEQHAAVDANKLCHLLSSIWHKWIDWLSRMSEILIKSQKKFLFFVRMHIEWLESKSGARGDSRRREKFHGIKFSKHFW